LLSADSAVKVWHEPLTIPTYPVGAPEPNPTFYGGRAYQGAKGPVYPYPFLDRLTNVRRDKTYQAVYLENKYLKLCVLPEIGGRIFSALDKTDNYDFFYRQHVIKPALIGMLGAWISGGVEWNIPHHHRATTFMTVDHALIENPDGSATIWVGELELRHRMRWLVGLTLYPDNSLIEVTLKIFNRTPYAHSILGWANTAVHAHPDYQVIFPPSTEYAAFHGKNQFSNWPISTEYYNRVDYTRGVDVSWWKNHPAPTSFFAWNAKEDFFAGYDHGKKAGVVFVADHSLVPGKKLWTWGTGSEGKIWEKILTETDGPYAELMIGAFSDNQPDYSWIQPYEIKTVKQYWFPIRLLGGVKNANAEAACNLEVKENSARFGFNVTSEYNDAKAVLKAGDKIIHEEKIDISPEKPFWEEIELRPGLKQEDLFISLFNAENREIISYKPQKIEKTAMPEPVKPPPAPSEINTVEELYLTGLRLEQFYNPVIEPYPYYEEALRRDPDNYQVSTSLSRLYLKRGMFQEAREKLQKAIQRATQNYTRPKDGEAYYYLGVSLRALGREDEAADAFSKATWSEAWHSASCYQLAELASKKGGFSEALAYLDQSLSSNVFNLKAINLEASLLRKLDRFSEAIELASMVLLSDPLDFWAANELYLAKASSGLRSEAEAEIKNLSLKMRDEVQNYLELAVDYGNCGLWDEAIDVLSRMAGSTEKKPSTFPMIYYYLGYFWEKKGESEKASKYADLANSMPPDYCFPFRLESIAVLRWAESVNPKDARAPYYLGNLLFDLQPEKAIEEWEKSKKLDRSFSIVHRNLGFAYARVKNDVSKAVSCLEKALACNKNDPKLYFELDQLYEANGTSPQLRLWLLEKNHKIVGKRDDALSREIGLLVQAGRFDRALELLSTHHFHVWEGGGEIHSVYVDAHLFRGQDFFRMKKYSQALKDFEAALEYPENLEVGKPYAGGRFPEISYFIGTAYEALGDGAKAKFNYENALASKSGWSDLSYYQGLALRKLSREQEAIDLFDGLVQFAKSQIEASPSIDFFAKFGEKQSVKIQQAHAHYLLGLGYLGLGKRTEAKTEFQKAIELNINHTDAQRQLSNL
jgi:tetratricopeptide (TPR) repeat protein